MLIGVAEKNLPGAIGPPFAWEVFCAQGVQVPLPRVEVVHLQREMIAAVVCEHGFRAVANDVQLLIDSEPKPRSAMASLMYWTNFTWVSRCKSGVNQR